MGTNYYVISDYCKCCDRYSEDYHIGKSSWGWSFTFQGYPEDDLVSWKKYKAFLKDKQIKDEYGEDITYEEFVSMIEKEKAPGFVRQDGHKNLQHNTEGKKKNWYRPDYDWDDDDGYAFTRTEFS